LASSEYKTSLYHSNGLLLKFSLRVGYGSFFVLRCTLDTDKFEIIINIIGYVSIVLIDICRSFLRVSKVTAKIKTRSKPTPSENCNSHPLCMFHFNYNFTIIVPNAFNYLKNVATREQCSIEL
jgi:hypothetical protein